MQTIEKIKKAIFIYHFLVLLLICFLTYKLYEVNEATSDAYYVAEKARIAAVEAKSEAEDARNIAEDAKDEAEDAKNEIENLRNGY
jgi:hypothetical protein